MDGALKYSVIIMLFLLSACAESLQTNSNRSSQAKPLINARADTPVAGLPVRTWSSEFDLGVGLSSPEPNKPFEQIHFLKGSEDKVAFTSVNYQELSPQPLYKKAWLLQQNIAGWKALGEPAINLQANPQSYQMIELADKRILAAWVDAGRLLYQMASNGVWQSPSVFRQQVVRQWIFARPDGYTFFWTSIVNLHESLFFQSFNLAGKALTPIIKTKIEHATEVQLSYDGLGQWVASYPAITAYGDPADPSLPGTTHYALTAQHLSHDGRSGFLAQIDLPFYYTGNQAVNIEWQPVLLNNGKFVVLLRDRSNYNYYMTQYDRSNPLVEWKPLAAQSAPGFFSAPACIAAHDYHVAVFWTEPDGLAQQHLHAAAWDSGLADWTLKQSLLTPLSPSIATILCRVNENAQVLVAVKAQTEGSNRVYAGEFQIGLGFTGELAEVFAWPSLSGSLHLQDIRISKTNTLSMILQRGAFHSTQPFSLLYFESN